MVVEMIRVLLKKERARARARARERWRSGRRFLIRKDGVRLVRPPDLLALFGKQNLGPREVGVHLHDLHLSDELIATYADDKLPDPASIPPFNGASRAAAVILNGI